MPQITRIALKRYIYQTHGNMRMPKKILFLRGSVAWEVHCGPIFPIYVQIWSYLVMSEQAWPYLSKSSLEIYFNKFEQWPKKKIGNIIKYDKICPDMIRLKSNIWPDLTWSDQIQTPVKSNLFSYQRCQIELLNLLKNFLY